MILEGIFHQEFTERLIYFMNADMTVTSTANVAAEQITNIDGSPRWYHTTKGLNAGGDIIYLKTLAVRDKPSFVP